jgi:preprotein translocase SecE subunit
MMMASATEAKSGVSKMSGVQQTPQGDAKGTPIERVRNYFNELRYELKKVSFPSNKELAQSTIVVFVFTLVMMGIISVFDVVVSLFFQSFILPPA